MREVIMTSILRELTKKTTFSEWWSWFKFNKFELAPGISLKFYTSVVKRLKIKVTKFWELILIFSEVTREKLVGGYFLTPAILSRVKNTCV